MAGPRKPPEQSIEFGRIAGSYGVRGWVKVVVDEPAVLAQQPSWWLDGVEFAVRETRLHSGRLLARLAGVESPEQAQRLKGKAVVIPRPAAGEGQYYWSDLVGLEVVNEQGTVLGVVKQLSFNGAHHVMEVAGDRTRLLPWVPAYVRKVDLPNRRIEVEWGADW